jgi:EAL domain-containing protein (putative c-di-GMP-specific phosphodiesterase class I)
MVDALIGLAHKLNLTACAEGVEDRATLDALGAFGVDFAQGYFISTPVPPAEIPRIVAHWDEQQRNPTARARTQR